MRENPFTIHPLLRKIYEQMQATLAKEYTSEWPATLDEIGPLFHVDAVMNEGEKRVGAIRIFLGLPPSKDGADVTLEMTFYPLTGQIGWRWHHGNGAAGDPGDKFMKRLLWVGNAPDLYAIYRVLELMEGHDRYCNGVMPIWEMLQKHPEGRGYREFTKTGARTLAKIVRQAPSIETPPEIENDGWYAYSRQRPYHEDDREPLEVRVGQVVQLLDVAAFVDDMLIIAIADKGRGEATIRRCPGDTLHGLTSVGTYRFFPVREKFARSLWSFVTPKFETSSYDVLKRLASERPAPQATP